MSMLTGKSTTAAAAMGELKKAADSARDAVLGFRDAMLGQNDAQTTFRQATLDHADALQQYADVQRRVRSGEITGAAAKRELAAAELAVQRSENGVARARVGIVRANKDAAASVKELTARHNEERDAALKAVQLARTAAQVTPSPSTINARTAAEKALADTLNRQAAELKPLIAETARKGKADTTAGRMARDMNATLREQAAAVARAREQMPPAAKEARGVGAAARAGAGGIKSLNNAAAATPGQMAAAASGAHSAGAAISQGLINGILSKIGEIRAAAARVAREAEAAQAAEAMIKSPSVKFWRLGRAMGAGTAKGLTDSVPDARKAAASVAREAGTSAARETDAAARKLAERTKKALTSRINAQKQAVSTAYERLAAAAMKAFDDRTDQMASGRQRGFDARFAGIDAAQSALTPAEAEIQRLEDARAAARLVQGLADAERDLAAAQAEGDANAVAQAQRAVDDARLEQQLAGLKERAAAERAAQDATAEERRTALQEEIDTSTRHFEAMRQIQRDSLEAALEAEKNKLLRGKVQQEQAQAQIIALLGRYGVEYTAAGERLGEMFAQGLIDSVHSVGAAAERLAMTVRRRLKLNSPAKEGPLSDLDRWWQPFAQVLVDSLDMRPLASAANGMAMRAPVPALAPAGGGGGGATVNVTVVDQTVTGMSREQARRLADSIAPELARRVTLAV
jgi:chromosome segregation ATPase